MQRIFEALSSRVRREVLLILAEGDLTAGQIAARFAISKSTLSQHLSILQVAGLVRAERRGQFIHYSLLRAPLAEALGDLLRGLWAETPDTGPPEQDEGPGAGASSYWRRVE